MLIMVEVREVVGREGGFTAWTYVTELDHDWREIHTHS